MSVFIGRGLPWADMSVGGENGVVRQSKVDIDRSHWTCVAEVPPDTRRDAHVTRARGD